MIEHCPLVTWQSLSQSETFPPLSVEWSQPIRDFPTIEPGMLQCHLLYIYILIYSSYIYMYETVAVYLHIWLFTSTYIQ